MYRLHCVPVKRLQIHQPINQPTNQPIRINQPANRSVNPPVNQSVICYMPPPPGGASPPPGTKTGWRSWLVGCRGEVFSRMMVCLSLTWLLTLIGGLGPSSPTRAMCWVDISQLLRPLITIFAPGPMVSPYLKRILVILSPDAFWKDLLLVIFWCGACLVF